MNVSVWARKEHLLRGYKALLEMKGYNLTDNNPESVIIDIGDNLTEVAQKISKNTPLVVAVFIVSVSWAGVVPQIADKTVVLREPVTAEMLLNALQL